MNQQKTVDIPKFHVLFLHNKFWKRSQDRYFVDLAVAVKESGHQVTIYASEFDPKNSFEEFNKLTGTLNVFYSGWWLPNKWKCIRAIVMALRMIFFPPAPKAKVIVLDIHPIALYIFSLIGSYKTIYVTNFASLQQSDFYSKYMRCTQTLLTTSCLRRATEVLVQSDGIADIFRRSFPKIGKDVSVVHPCLDTGLWLGECIKISRIVPDIPNPCFLFVCFGPYKKRSNFKLVLEAYDEVLNNTEEAIRTNLHLVIAGHCSNINSEEREHYSELVHFTKDKPFASQVTFLTQLPTVHKKTLIHEATGIILPCKYDVFPDSVLAVLSCGRPIVAARTGFAGQVLTHRMSGILVEPSVDSISSSMLKLLNNPAIQVFLSDLGHELFKKNYSHHVFRRKINSLIRKCALGSICAP